MKNSQPLSEVSAGLQKALKEAEAAQIQLEKAEAKADADYQKAQEQLIPLRSATREKNNVVESYMNQFRSMTGVPKVKGRGRPAGVKRGSYNITPEAKVAATIKRQTTRAINAGKSEAEAKKVGAAAGKALAAKLGV